MTSFPRLSVNTVGFMQQSLARQGKIWGRLGVGAVSLVGPQLDAEGLDAARQALAAAGVHVESIVHPFSQFEPLTIDQSSWVAPRDALSRRIGAAVELGARSIYMTTGGAGDLTWEQAAEVFSAAVAPGLAEARDAGIALMIENSPFLYADLHFAHTLRDTVTLAEMAGVGVCIDLFSCWTEAGLEATLHAALPRCDLVQVSDYVRGDRALPARAVPGDGALPLPRLLGWIVDAGYRGTFELELLGPRIEAEGAAQATARAVQVTRQILQSLGVE